MKLKTDSITDFFTARFRNSPKLKADSITGSFTDTYDNFLSLTLKTHRLRHELFHHHLYESPETLLKTDPS